MESVLNQSFEDFELLICDDGSTEDAQRLLNEYEAKDSRVRLLRTGYAIALPTKLNVCLHEARGAYLARMDDDDYSCPDRFERQIYALKQNPKADFCGCNVFLYRDGKCIGQRILPEYPEVQDFYMTQPFIHPTLFFHRSVLEVVGGYSEASRCNKCEDYDLLLRLYAAGYKGMNIQKPLLEYTAPDNRGNRTLRHRWNETVTRWVRFRELGVLPQALPYVFKPIAVGLLPTGLLGRLKERKTRPIDTTGSP